MQHYYKIHKIMEDIYCITEPHYHEHANMFLFCGAKKSLLVDCGLGLVDIKKFLATHGVKKVQVIITHSHFDHMGGIQFFSPHEIIIPYPLPHAPHWGVEYLHEKDFDKKYYEKNFNKDPKQLVQEYTIHVPPYAVYRKKTIAIGKYFFQIIRTPGHTHDSITLFDKKNKTLLTGDTLYSGTLYASFPNSDKKKYRKTLLTLAQLDFQLVLPGHNKVLTKKQALQVIHQWTRELG